MLKTRIWCAAASAVCGEGFARRATNAVALQQAFGERCLASGHISCICSERGQGAINTCLKVQGMTVGFSVQSVLRES